MGVCCKMANDISAFLAPEDVLVDLDARCKREALNKIGDHAASRLGLEKSQLVEALMDREQLGTTAVGHGIAIPHAKVAVDRLWGALARVSRPIDFDALDDQPVDLVFLLLAPEGASAEHLKALSRIARFVRSEPVRKALRGAPDAPSLYGFAIGEIDAEAA